MKHAHYIISMVGVKGLEPSTSRSQTARASQLRHTPRFTRNIQPLQRIFFENSRRKYYFEYFFRHSSILA